MLKENLEKLTKLYDEQVKSNKNDEGCNLKEDKVWSNYKICLNLFHLIN